MVKVRTAKIKGSQFEYDCQHSLQNWTNNPVTRTSERGFQMQYDLRIDTDSDGPFLIECKRLAGISWNQLVKFYEKLESVTKHEEKAKLYLLFQSNRQPCLVFHKLHGKYQIETFEDHFMTKFEKHKSTRSPRTKSND